MFRAAAGAAIAAINVGMIFYIYLFGVRQEISQDKSYIQSFRFWLFMDCVVLSSLYVFIWHFYLPGKVGQELTNARRRLLETAQERNRDTENEGETDQGKFNLAEYTFISYRLATHYPSLKESQILLDYSQQLPLVNYEAIQREQWDMSTTTRIFLSSAVSILEFFLQCPVSLQDAVIGSANTLGFGYISMFLCTLWGMDPAYVVLLIFGVTFLTLLYAYRRSFCRGFLYICCDEPLHRVVPWQAHSSSSSNSNSHCNSISTATRTGLRALNSPDEDRLENRETSHSKPVIYITHQRIFTHPTLTTDSPLNSLTNESTE